MKFTHSNSTSNSNVQTNAQNTQNPQVGQLRSGMSVQDLKRLTAQRAEQERLQYIEQYKAQELQYAQYQAQYISTSPLKPSHSGRKPHRERLGSCESTTSTSSSTLSSDSNPTLTNQPTYSPSNPYSSYTIYGPPQHSNYSPTINEKTFITTSGQMVALLDNVVNAPPMVMESNASNW